MRKVHCDKCGTVMNEFSFEVGITATVTIHNAINEATICPDQSEFHLCYDCTKELRTWLGEKKEAAK